MKLRYKMRAAAGTFHRKAYRGVARQFLASTRDCRGVQSRVLNRLLSLNADSDFSRKHRLHGDLSVADFRSRLPVSDFEYFRPYVDRLKLGETSALLGPANKLIMFSLTSGTTSEAKFIPITSEFLKDYRRGWHVWGINTFDAYNLHYRHIVQFSSSCQQFRTPAGIPCGNISGLVASMQNRLLRSYYSVPPEVGSIEDSEAKRYAGLRIALMDENVGMVMTANPATLVQMARFGDEHRDLLIRDIADGTLSDQFPIEPEVRAKLKHWTQKARPKRARWLESIIESTGELHPKSYWNDLDVIAVWTCGSAGAYLPMVKDYFGDVPARDHGLHASEGRMTIPLDDGDVPAILDVTAHFFEFIPESEHGTKSPTVLQAHELEVDENYYILMTTSSGLYRYDIRDVVRCVGFEGTTPTFRFLHKGAHVSNVAGEKISESQVVQAVRQSARELKIELNHFTVAPRWDDPPHYELLVDERLANGLGRSLANRTDELLQTINCEYHEKRGSRRLNPMTCISLPSGTWQRFMQRQTSGLGGSFEQYKHPCLVADLDFRREIEREFLSA